MNGPIDLEALREIMDDDDELVKDCFNDFIEDCGEMLSLIKSAIETDNPGEVEKAAHALKGSLIYLAAKDAAGIAWKIEAMGQKRELSRAPEAFSALRSACNELIAFMKTY